jgi:hypothetical protein
VAPLAPGTGTTAFASGNPHKPSACKDFAKTFSLAEYASAIKNPAVKSEMSRAVKATLVVYFEFLKSLNNFPPVIAACSEG